MLKSKLNSLLIIGLIFVSKYDFKKINRKDNFVENYGSYNTYLSQKDYLLMIDKINLSYVLNDTETLETGLEIHNISYEQNRPLVIMGHSGLGLNVYFNKLDQLIIGDEIVIYKNEKKYIYEIINISYHEKRNDLYVEKSNEYLYLITCDKYNMQKQLIICSKIAKNA